MNSYPQKVKSSILNDLWNFNSEVFDELVVELKASIQENGSVEIEDDYFDRKSLIFKSNEELVDWLKDHFFNHD